MPKDKCYKKVKAQYKVFPSARASQAIAKCRKASGKVVKSKSGASLRRWQLEDWIDTMSGKPCGAGGETEYCRPSNKVSNKTPKTAKELGPKKLAQKQKEKRKLGMGKRVKKA